MTVALAHLRNATIGVFGLARSGLATVEAAVKGGAGEVFAWDEQEGARQRAAALGAEVERPEDWDWGALALVALSPGVPLTHPRPHPIVAVAQAAGAEIVCDIELLFREAEGKARIVAVTGTNGKSTTTALIGHVLAACGLQTQVGGNIGRAALDLAHPQDGLTYVLELSSYQLDLTSRFRPDVAVWLNLSPDHLDRHGDMAGYRRAKERVFANMREGDTAIVGIDEPDMVEVASALRARRAPAVETVSVTSADGAGLAVNEDGALIENGQAIASFANLPTLRGRHNWQNAAAAFAAARALGVAPGAILDAMASFPGLAHRMEIVGRRGRVLFVNDSKATNADAAGRALSTFEPVYWIAGGQPKEGGIAPLSRHFPRIAKAYLIGAAAEAFSETLARRVPHVIAGDLQTAVRLASADAAEDDAGEPAVLLSPACASFDQFADFEARGDSFRSAFAALDAGPNAEEKAR